MGYHRRKTERTRSLPVGVGIGILTAMAIALVGAMILAATVDREMLRESGIGGGSTALQAAASAIGAAVAFRQIRSRRMLVCLLCGGCFLAVLLGCGLLFFEGGIHGVGRTAAAVMLSSCAVGLLGLRGGKRAGKRVRAAISR